MSAHRIILIYKHNKAGGNCYVNFIIILYIYIYIYIYKVEYISFKIN